MVIVNGRILNVRRILAFLFIIGGLVASILNGVISGEICFNCLMNQQRITSLILLFVEIIFIICGATLLLGEIYSQ